MRTEASIRRSEGAEKATDAQKKTADADAEKTTTSEAWKTRTAGTARWRPQKPREVGVSYRRSVLD